MKKDKKNHTCIGAPMERKEDSRLLIGKGQFTSDFFPEGICYAFIVRSPYPHAIINNIDVSKALRQPGVFSVLTGNDLSLHDIRAIPHNAEWQGAPDAEISLPEGFEVFAPEHTVLATERARYVGEPVATIIAETEELAASAADFVEVNYSQLPAVIDAREAIKEGAPEIWLGRTDNISLNCKVGDEIAANQAFSRAKHVIKFDSWVQRITGSPMEPRAVIGEYDPRTKRYTLRSASGRGAVQTRERLAHMLNVPISQCRVIFGDMGGNFGTRNAFFPEAFLIPWASKIVGRPVKWTATRSECFLSDYQGRDLHVETELALDETGKFLGLRGLNISNLGSHAAYFWPLRKGLSLMQSIYNIPAVYFKGLAVFTNTPPTAVYRSAGRPEAIYAIERLIDLAAEQCGFDRVELRRQNMISSNALPFTTAVGVTYDSGDYVSAMNTVLVMGDWNGFEDRRRESLERGLCRGRAVCNYIEVTSGIPRERAELNIRTDGKIELIVGTMSSGQGHETSYAQVVSDWLGIPFDSIVFIANDTDRVSVGGGSHSGRSMRLVSIAIREAIEDLINKGKLIAAHVYKVNPEQIDYKNGGFWLASSDCVLNLAQLAEASLSLNSIPEELQGGFIGIGDITNHAGGYPYGAHMCEVEVDPETGMVEIKRWTGVDDVGLAVNPLILHGQAHGAITQGIGQALFESMQYSNDGQLLSGSFMDYTIPRAHDVPFFKTIISETPATSHPFGIRPGGEGGTTPALGVIINAITDALAELGVKHVEMPATPERVWRAIQTKESI